jgi:hypothetical protein
MDLDPQELGDFDSDFLKHAKVSWLTKLVLGVSLKWGMARLARELAMPGGKLCKKAHALFDEVEKVDIIPSRSDMRGFQIVLNRGLSLFFYQDGDHFVYDGFEMGPYPGGDVTVFDKLR